MTKKKQTSELVKDFCTHHNITEDQFYGREKVGGDLDLRSVTSIPDGFNPTVGGYLDQSFAGPDYAVDTLINGNISECIRYLRVLIGSGSIHGMNEAHEQLVKIKDACPDRYDYIKEKTFSL